MWNHASSIIAPPHPDDQAWFPPQSDLLKAGFFESDDHWLICAPTGSGKTRMGEWALLSAIQQGRIGVYLAPLKAIVEERLTDWQARFPDLSVGLFTGDRFGGKATGRPGVQDLLLLTPEKLASYLSNWKSHLPWLSRIGALVVDEIHLLGDPGRGAGLECLLTRLRRINPFARIVGLSGTLSNAGEIASWLDARMFTTDWRPIPVEHRIVRFSKAEQKQALLLEEIHATLSGGGRALVFTNSRRRAESLAKFLDESGIRAAFTHAGLDPKRRESAHSRMREGSIDVLTTTSSLEMGVNFPARKVVVYDSYGFDGETFGPLPVARYLQAAGRAGRAGLDPFGESVLFLPKWAGAKPDYASRIPEPIRSGLFQKRRRTFEVLVDVSGRLSISETHLATNFAMRTLWRRQGGDSEFGGLVRDLIDAGLLRRDSKTEAYLSETALGRIACQMVVEPATIALLARFFEAASTPSDFDLLLTACLASECTPKLGFNFEEIDRMADTLLSVPSAFLDLAAPEIERIQGRSNPRQLLAAIKSAVLMHRHISGDSLEALAEEFDAYPYDLHLLRQNLGWVLAVAGRVFAYLWSKEHEGEEVDPDEEMPKSAHQRICETLALMVEYGVSRESVDLVRVPGIGGKRVHSLAASGVCSLQEFLSADMSKLAGILRLKSDSLGKLLCAAEKVAAEMGMEDPFALDPAAPSAPPPVSEKLAWPKDIDPYRLRRALELKVDHRSEDAVNVSGGAEPHRVAIQTNARRVRNYACDCADFAKGHSQCKHVLRARLELLDDADLLPLLRDLGQSGSRPLRYALADLWMNVGGLYDRYAGRHVDYTGERFLRKATAPSRR